MWELLGVVVCVVVTIWLLGRAAEWWFRGSVERDISDPARHASYMAEWQRHLDDAQQQLDYYQNTPNWFDLEWPVCDHLSMSADGEYCRNCFRQVGDHAMVMA